MLPWKFSPPVRRVGPDSPRRPADMAAVRERIDPEREVDGPSKRSALIFSVLLARNSVPPCLRASAVNLLSSGLIARSVPRRDMIAEQQQRRDHQHHRGPPPGGDGLE